MSYVSKGEKIFQIPNSSYVDCSPPLPRRSDHRLKRFPSIYDGRAWTCCAYERYRYMYELVSGSRTCLEPKPVCLKYISLETIVAILLAEKLAYIKQLEKMLGLTNQSAIPYDNIPSTSADGQHEPSIHSSYGYGYVSPSALPSLPRSPAPSLRSSIQPSREGSIESSGSPPAISSRPSDTPVVEIHPKTSAGSISAATPVISAEPSITPSVQPSDRSSALLPSGTQTSTVSAPPVLPVSTYKPSTSVEPPKKVADIYKAEKFEESDEDKEILNKKNAEFCAMKNKMENLQAELTNCRDTLRRAMNKLETIDEILSENHCLKDKLRRSEEMIKFLEEKKRDLEKELEKLRSSTQITIELEKAQEELDTVREQEENAQGNEDWLRNLAEERDALHKKVDELQRELCQSRRCKNEIELLKKKTLNLEEVSKENECYKKKLGTMRCLEKQIAELKQQASELTDKYKRESKKASDQMKQLSNSAREVKMLREEKDRLQKRVEELSSYECRCDDLQKKLEEMESTMSENECLRPKILELDKLEIENEQLRCKINELKCAELEAAGDKERILQLQRAVADQEEEMKDLLNQIERLTRWGKQGGEETSKLKADLEEACCKLKLCEQQLAEIPLLEAEIDELKSKMQKCCESFSPDRESLKRLHRELELYRKRLQKVEGLSWELPRTPQPSAADSESTMGRESRLDSAIIETSYEDDVTFKEQKALVLESDKGESFASSQISDRREPVTCEEVQRLLKSSKEIISGVLEDMIEHQREMEELEEHNQAMKDEIEMLKARMGKTDLDDLCQEIIGLKACLKEKDKKICKLQRLVCISQGVEKIKERIDQLECEIEILKEQNQQLQKELQEAGLSLARTAELEEMLQNERKARSFAEDMVKHLEEETENMEATHRAKESLSKLQKEEANLASRQSISYYMREVEDLRNQLSQMEKLCCEMRKENELLHELQKPCPEFTRELEEKAELKNLLSKLQEELDSMRMQNLSDECNALREELKRLIDENSRLKKQISCVKECLEQEKKSRSLIEAQLSKSQAESAVSSKTQAGKRCSCTSKPYGSKTKQKEVEVSKDDVNKIQADLLKCLKERDSWKCEAQALKMRNKSLQSLQVTQSDGDEDEMTKMRRELQCEIMNLEQLLATKECELKKCKAEVERLKCENQKMVPEREVLQNRLKESEGESSVPKVDYKKDLAEKHKLEKTMRDMELEMEALRKKLEDCRRKEDEYKEIKKERDELRSEVTKLSSEIDAREKEKMAEDAKRAGAVDKGKSGADKGKSDKEKAEADKGKTEADKGKAEADKGKSRTDPGKPVPDKTKPGTSDDKVDCDKLLEEIRHLRGQISNLQAETIRHQGENKKLNDRILKETKPTTSAKDPCGTSEDSIVTFSDVDPDFDKFKRKLCSEDHKQNIAEIEKRYQNKIQQLEEANAMKIRKLMEQNEKEGKRRDKDFNNSINMMKSNYEADIKKLTEKHRASILRLQTLHEDELREVNSNYETQMEEIQTQNENVITDLTSSAAEKFKQLTENHNKDVKNLEIKYQQVLEEKEAQHLFEISNLQANLTQNMDEVEEFHRKTMEDITQALEGNIAELEAKHCMELKKLKKSNLKRIDMMKHKYEDLLMEERKKYEAQLEAKLRKGQQGDECECKFFEFKIQKARDPNAALEFYEIIEKILNEGLEALTFNEIVLIHCKICCAAEGKVIDPEFKAELEPPIGDGCVMPLMKADKEQLMHRICLLENEIKAKELETQEAIINMEIAVKTERRRLEEIKNVLYEEQKKNPELKILLTSQSRLRTDLKVERDMLNRQASLHENKVIEKVRELEKERSDRRCLELLKTCSSVKQLSATLDSERQRFYNQRRRDTECLEASTYLSMKVRLEHSMNNEHRLRSQLEYESKSTAKLECELQSLQRSFYLMIDLPAVEFDKKGKTQIEFQSKNVKDRKPKSNQYEEKRLKIKSRPSSKKSKKS